MDFFQKIGKLFLFLGNAQKIKMALAYKSMSESELTKALDKTPQSFNQRMKTDKFSTDGLNAIAEALGGSYDFFYFSRWYKNIVCE